MAAGVALAALFATIFAFWAFNIASSPRSAEALLFPTATPTIYTPAPPTPTPVAGIPLFDTLLFHDDLSQSGAWPSGPRSSYTRTGYALSPADGDYFAGPAPGFDSSQYRSLGLQTVAFRSDDSAGEWGIFFWHSIDRTIRERFISFTITPRGTFRLRTYAPFTSTTGERVFRWTDLVPETTSKEILSGKPNRLRIEVRPGLLKAYINGSQVLDRSNADIDAYRTRSGFDGQVGLIVIPGGASKSVVEFRQFTVYSLADSQ